MKPRFVPRAFAIFLFIVQPSFAASEAQREFERLTQEREKALAVAAEPINRRYLAVLEPLLKKATQAILRLLWPLSRLWKRFQPSFRTPAPERTQKSSERGFSRIWLTELRAHGKSPLTGRLAIPGTGSARG